MPTNNALPLITVQDVQDAVRVNLPNLTHGQPYPLEDLVGTDRWQATHKGHRNQLGQQYKVLALAGEQPVRWVDTRSDNSNVYQLR
jgi:hypothetical protein